MNLTELLSQIDRADYIHNEAKSELEEFWFHLSDKVIVVTTCGNVEEWDQYGETFIRNLT